MKLGFSSTTMMTSNLETDVAISAQAGFTGMDIWASKSVINLQKQERLSAPAFDFFQKTALFGGFWKGQAVYLAFCGEGGI